MNDTLQKFRQAISEGIRDAVRNAVVEDRVVKFDNKVYPRFNQAIIMAGAAGSGKGYSINKYVPIDGKHMDVDTFKSQYVRMLNDPNSRVFKSDLRRQSNPDLSVSGDQLYNMGNPADTAALHAQVKGHGWKQKSRYNFFNADQNRNPERLPNVILDITGTDTGELTRLAVMCSKLGYKTHLVWVVTSRSRAMHNNLSRDRKVPQEVFHDAHNDIREYLPPYVQNEAGQFFDNAWLVFNSSVELSPKTPEEEKNTCVKLEKKGQGFDIKPSDYKRLMDILGQGEDNPDKPTRYQDFSDVIPNLDRYSFKNARAGDSLLR